MRLMMVRTMAEGATWHTLSLPGSKPAKCGKDGGEGPRRSLEGQQVPFGKRESSDQCQPVHAKNPQHGSPDSGPVAAQPARAPIATASSAMNNHRPLSPISEDLIR